MNEPDEVSPAEPADAHPPVTAASIDPEQLAAYTKAANERIKAILECSAAKDRPKLAAHLALETSVTAEDALAILANAASEVATGPFRFASAEVTALH